VKCHSAQTTRSGLGLSVPRLCSLPSSMRIGVRVGACRGRRAGGCGWACGARASVRQHTYKCIWCTDEREGNKLSEHASDQTVVNLRILCIYAGGVNFSFQKKDIYSWDGMGAVASKPESECIWMIRRRTAQGAPTLLWVSRPESKRRRSRWWFGGSRCQVRRQR
jgi:hypothetical protein